MAICSKDCATRQGHRGGNANTPIITCFCNCREGCGVLQGVWADLHKKSREAGVERWVGAEIFITRQGILDSKELETS